MRIDKVQPKITTKEEGNTVQYYHDDSMAGFTEI